MTALIYPEAPAPPFEGGAAMEHTIRRAFAAESQRWVRADACLASFLRDVEGWVLHGGKRLRPRLVHCGFIAGDPAADDDVLPELMAAVELLHAFALLHDDVMDGAEHRRGIAAFHAAARDRHRSASWHGEGRRFGEGMAILAGDLCFVMADRLVSTAPPQVREVWNELRIEVVMGQHLDLLGAATGNRDPRRATVIAELKTARYTVERPLELGATLAGADPATIGALRAFGRPLGLAFQFRDDLLGAVGDASVTGKPVGDDLREGKPTYLLAIASSLATPADRALLARAGERTLTDDDIEAMQAALHRSGAVAIVEEALGHLRDRALRALEGAPLHHASVEELTELAELLAFRSR